MLKYASAGEAASTPRAWKASTLEAGRKTLPPSMYLQRLLLTKITTIPPTVKGKTKRQLHCPEQTMKVNLEPHDKLIIGKSPCNRVLQSGLIPKN